MDSKSYDLIVLGSGPGGYVAAIRSAQLGMKTAIVEKAELGGVCLNWGCIPTKALLKSAKVFHYLNHAEDYGLKTNNVSFEVEDVVSKSRGAAEKMSKGVKFLLKKNNIDVHQGFGKLTSNSSISVESEENTTELKANHIIIATGAQSRSITVLPQDGEKIVGYREAMVPNKIPETLAIVGAGAIGVEFAYFYSSMGSKVTLIESMNEILPNEDPEVSNQLRRSLKKLGVKVKTETMLKASEVKASVSLTLESKKGEEIIEVEKVISAIGVKSNLENIGLEDIGVIFSNDKIEVDQWYQTNLNGVYAIGDIVKGPALAHVASAEAILCIEKIVGHEVLPIDYNNIPSCTYCSPEVASVGFTEEKAKEAGFEDLKIGKFPFSASGKATTNGDTTGFVKVIYDAKYGELLGCHMIGDGVTDMIAEAVVARKLETTGLEILKTVHPHPTLSEALMEATAAAYDEVIHL